MIRPGSTLLAVGGGVAAIVLATSLLGPATEVGEQHPPELQPVERTTVVCPYAEDPGDRVKTRIAALAMGDVTSDGEGDTEPVTVAPLQIWDSGIDLDEEPTESPEPTESAEPTESPESTESPEPEETPDPLFTVAERGDPAVKAVKSDEPTSFAVDVRGPMAAGVAAETMTYARTPQLHGFSSVACDPPSREHWFVGGSGAEGKRGTLVLSNPSNVDAVVDVDVWSGSGPVEAAATQDVNVPPKSQRTFLLDALAPEAAQVAVHVSTERGKVSAAIAVRESDEGESRGISYVPAAVAPSTEMLIPGVSGAGRPTLQVFAPGDTDAIVSLSYLGENGTFTPAGQDVVTVAAGSILSVPLEDVEAPIAVALTSDQPVTAAVRIVRTSDDGPRDVAFSAASAPLSGPAATLLGRESSNFTTSLLFSSHTATRAEVQTLDGDGNVVDEQTIDVPDGTTVTLDLEEADDTSYPYAVVRPADPDTLVVARQVRASNDVGAFIDALPLIAPAIEVQVPEVVNELPEIPDPEETAENP